MTKKGLAAFNDACGVDGAEVFYVTPIDAAEFLMGRSRLPRLVVAVVHELVQRGLRGHVFRCVGCHEPVSVPTVFMVIVSRTEPHAIGSGFCRECSCDEQAVRSSTLRDLTTMGFRLLHAAPERLQ